MKVICYSALLLAFILLAGFYVLREDEQVPHLNESGEDVVAALAKDVSPMAAASAGQPGLEEEGGFSTDASLAMNSPYARKSDGLYDRLRSDPPEGMEIGKLRDVKIEDGRDDTKDWHKRTRMADNTQERAEKLLNAGEGGLPGGFHADDIVFSASGACAIVGSGGVGAKSYLLRSDNGRFDPRTAVWLPEVNYEDKVRRWTIRWEGFLTDQRLLGVMYEPDKEIENPVRVHYYIYDVPNSTLSRLVMPGEMEGDDPAEIEATSDNAILIRHGGSYRTVTIQDS